MPRFRIATLTWVGYGPIYLAAEKGFFRGIDVRILRIEDTAARRAALASGSVDGSTDIVDSFTNGAAAGLAASVVLKLDDSMGGDGIVVRGDIDELQDLEGRTVAYPPGQPSHYFLLSVLADAGMSIDQVESRLMEADQAGAAFLSGSVDAAVTWEPWLTRAAALPDGRVLMTSMDTPGLISDIFTVRNDFLEENPATVEAFVRGWLEAVEYWRENPEESNAIMADALDLSPEEFAEMVSGVRYADAEVNRAFFNLDESGDSQFRATFSRASNIWQEQGVLANPVDAASVDGSSVFFSALGTEG